jgi:cytochrome b subunit of formate dehydrogenase
VTRWLIALAGLGAAVAAGVAALAQAGSGSQPWDPELSDNFVFVKIIPFAVALGVAFGVALGGRRTPAERTGEVRRFAPATVAGHWLITIAFLLALPTGVWQYMGGILDIELPLPLYLIYRVHYIGAALILVMLGFFLAYWSMDRDRSLLVPRGEWRRHLTGLAHELPSRLGAILASRLRLDLRGEPPAPGKFTFYETAFSFPTWTFVLALITLTGLVKAARYVLPVPGPILYGASTLHVAAMVLIVIKILDHLRYTFARWPLVVAMATGWMRRREARVAVASAAGGGDE